jgi:hypothetical protein
MIYQNAGQTAKNVFTTLPENLLASDMLLWAGTCVLAAWMFILVVAGRRKKHPVLRMLTLLFAAFLGIAGYILYQNVNENIGGYYLNGRISDEMLFPKVKSDSDSPGVDYVIYFPGSIMGKRLKSDIVKTATGAVIPHGYNDAVRRFAAKLRPQDRLHLIGFSRGGGEALAAAQGIRRPIASLVLADPTADLLQAFECRISTCKKPANVEFFKVFTVHNYDAKTASNDCIRDYLFFMMARFIDRRYVEYGDSGDHGMYDTGYRIDERSGEALEQLRLRVIADHAGFVSANRTAEKGK